MNGVTPIVRSSGDRQFVTTTSVLAVIIAAMTTTAAAGSWLVVALGDSTPAGYGVRSDLAYPAIYGSLVAVDLGIEVNVANHATGETRSVAEWVDLLLTDEKLAADLAGAEIVTVWLGWHDILPIVHLKTTRSWPDPMRQQLQDRNAELATAWDDLLAAVQSTAPQGATVLVADTGLPAPLIEMFGGEPFWPELKRLVYLDWRDVLVRAAKEHGAIVVPTWAALSGPDGETELHPEFGSEDGFHMNETGQRFLAGLHRQHDGLGGG